MAGDGSTPSNNFQLPSLSGVIDSVTRIAPYPMNPEEEQRWLARRDVEQRTDSSSLPLLPSRQAQSPILPNIPLQQPYHQYTLPSPAFLRQPAPIRPQSWGFSGPLPNLGSTNSMSSSSTNSYIPTAQSNSFNQSYQPLPYPSPVSPAFSIPNNSHPSSSSSLPPPSSLQHQAFQPILPGNWTPSLPPPKLHPRAPEPTLLPPPSRESFPGMYEKTVDHSRKQPTPVIPMVSSTSGGVSSSQVSGSIITIRYLPRLFSEWLQKLTELFVLSNLPFRAFLYFSIFTESSNCCKTFRC